jgi:hypothetical protein
MTGGYNPANKNIFSLAWRLRNACGIRLIPRPHTGVKMIRFCIRQAVRVFAGSALFACAIAAHATSIQMNCDSLTLSGTPPNQILTCNIGSAPPGGCSISGASTGLIGTPTTLTAVCTTGTTPFTFAWSGGSTANCGNAMACAVSDSATTTYSVAISNAQGAFTPSPTKQVAWSNTPIGPAGCAITASTNSLPVGGGSVNLSMDCSTGSGLSYSWTGGFAANATSQQVSGTVSATTTFTATASNGGGTSTKTATVSVATGNGGGPIACTGYLNTNVYTATWPFSANGSVPMGALDAGVVKFTTGSAAGTGNIALSTSGNNAGTKHDYTLSTQPCDFGTGIKRYAGAGAITFRMTVSSTPGSYPNLLPNTTYYINVRNNDVSGCVSTNSTCDLYPVNLTGP